MMLLCSLLLLCIPEDRGSLIHADSRRTSGSFVVVASFALPAAPQLDSMQLLCNF